MKRTLRGNDVVFMYAAPKYSQTYNDYGTTVVAWGGAHKPGIVHDMRTHNIHPTASMWCLTAGAKTLHENTALREQGVCRDITGTPIIVPWLFDHKHEGTPAYFGCTNSPVFRDHVRNQVRNVMAAGADGLHVDDPLGAAQPVPWLAGCFCEYCVAGFCEHLAAHPDLAKRAGVNDLAQFDYRRFSLQFGATREAYVLGQNKNPLHNDFHDWQLAQCTANLRELGELAEAIAGRPITLSANTCLPELRFLPLTQVCDYLIAENDHHATDGTANLSEAILAYRMGEALNKPMATTARGQDWALVKANDLTHLPTLWIALAYACGHRFMAPHRQWCYSQELGTHWYDGPTEAYAPIYQFVATNPALFAEHHAVGPLATPTVPNGRYIETAERAAFHTALTLGDPQPLSRGPLRLFPREARDASHVVVHLLNYDYTAPQDRFAIASDISIHLPSGLLRGTFRHCKLHSPGQAAESLLMTCDNSGIHFTVPQADIWSIVELTE